MRVQAPAFRTQGYNSLAFMAKYFAQGTSTAILGIPASAVWPGANRAIYLPVEVDAPMVVTRMFVYNGTSVAGSVDIGLYAADGTRLVSIGTGVSQTGTSVVQIFDVTDTLIGRGAFYLGVAFTSGSAQVFRFAGGAANDWLMWGALQQASAHPLPANATFASNQMQYLPVCGFAGR